MPIKDFAVFINGVLLDVDDVSKVKCDDYSINDLQKMSDLTIGKLFPLTTYTVQVQTVNSLSQCYTSNVFSDPVTFTTYDISRPGPPNVTVIENKITGGGAQIRIIDPLDTGGNEITRYQLYYSMMGSMEWNLGYSGSNFLAQIAGLQPLTSYNYKASVFNGIFESMNSSTENFNTSNISSPGVCSPPTLVSSTGGMLNVTWINPPDNGGSPVTNFSVSIVSATDGSYIHGYEKPTTVNGLYYAFYKLSAETNYTVKVQAKNSKGLGPMSDPVVFQTNVSSISQGAISVNIFQITGGAATIKFNEPEDLGGTPSENMIYQVYVDSENIQNVSSTVSGSRRLSETVHRYLKSSTSTTAVVGGLDASNLYSIQIRPVNVVGGGTISNESPALTSSASVPGPPIDVASYTVTGGSIMMTWNPPIDTGGVALGNYNVFMATNQTGVFANVCHDIAQVCEINNLNPSSRYWFYVTVSNSVGVSPSSSVVYVDTQSITPPSHPVNMQIIGVGYDSIQIQWDAPKDAGGDAIAGYVVTIQNEDLSTLADIQESQASASIAGLQAGTAYSVSVVSIVKLPCFVHIIS